MKKLFAALFTFMFFCPILSAQNFIRGPLPGGESLFKEYYQKCSKMVDDSIKENQQNNKKVKFSQKIILAAHATIEQNQIDVYPSDYEGVEVVVPEPESKISGVYEEATFSVPAGYTINKYIKFDNGNKPYLPFVSENSILVFANREDISFKLDYDISIKEDDTSNITEGYLYNALDFTIRYSPKYFALVPVSDNYNPSQTVEFEYNGKTVVLDTEIYPVLIITTPEGKNTSYILRPYFEKIYADFEFVRKGHKPAQYLQR